MSTKVPSDTRAKTAKELRKLRGRRLGLRMLIAVGLPTLIAAIYNGVLMTPRYESVTSFTVQSADGIQGGSALMMLVTNVPGTATRDVLVAVEYMRSRDMLDPTHRGARLHGALRLAGRRLFLPARRRRRIASARTSTSSST